MVALIQCDEFAIQKRRSKAVQYGSRLPLVLQFQDGRKIDMQRSSLADDDNHPPQSLRQLQTYLKQLYGLS